ncbi:cyclic nucleotide-binding and patatin-like phospholipase domain-containing protein [Cyanobium sp. NIES-981]|uniref:patatin-like phospholipase family protein n=1 Tax=Cyanobium sp. NIES-981 TaxID=1851505 RepID=UPI0007DDE194|nr:cyclic nucleotide-binding and patatin-like phospholipase domain-containing protein [Cyanobium sp. NIES-981]SBO44910.1 Patatin [Cyanobium sp. NIES-981]
MTTELTALLASALSGSGLLAGLDPAQITGLAPGRGRIEEGGELFRRGELGRHAYLVLQGVLGLHTGEAGQPGAFFRKVVAGELVGEYSPLSGEPRSASALALTAVDYLAFDRHQLDQLLECQPCLQTRFITALAEAASIGRDPGCMPLETIVIHLASPGSALTAAVLAQLPGHLRRLCGQLEILPDLQLHGLEPDAAGSGEAAGEQEPGDDPEARLHARLIEATRTGRPQLIVNRDPRAVSRRNRLLIDRLLILCDGEASRISLPEAADGEALLVRLWPREQQQPRSRDWATSQPFAQVLNLQPGRSSHLDRLARAILRRQNVLVLGGGGARGFAHIGALAALEELGLRDFDMVMGVSIGSLVASLAAFDLPAAEIFANLERVIIKARPYSFTLPRGSLFTLRNSRLELERFFGSARLQDSWLPLRCFSTNLSTNQLETWSTGAIPDAVIASMSVPGIFPPVEDARGHLHVDGGILNNLPVAAARRASDGRVVAISLDPEPAAATPAAGGSAAARTPPSLGRTIIDAMMCGSHAATQAQERLADLILRPDIGGFPFLEWKRYREIYAEGYAAAQARFREGWPAGH